MDRPQFYRHRLPHPVLSMLLFWGCALSASSGGSPLEAGPSASIVESHDDVHVSSRLLSGLEDKLDAAWELPPQLRGIGTQELLSLSETAAASNAGAQPLECADTLCWPIVVQGCVAVCRSVVGEYMGGRWKW